MAHFNTGGGFHGESNGDKHYTGSLFNWTNSDWEKQRLIGWKDYGHVVRLLRLGVCHLPGIYLGKKYQTKNIYDNIYYIKFGHKYKIICLFIYCLNSDDILRYVPPPRPPEFIWDTLKVDIQGANVDVYMFVYLCTCINAYMYMCMSIFKVLFKIRNSLKNIILHENIIYNTSAHTHI